MTDPDTVIPDPESGPGTDAPEAKYDGLRHRRIIGYIGMALVPVLLITSALWGGTVVPTSVSAYWYTPAQPFFVGLLFAIAVYFWGYRGYEGVREDVIAARIAMVCAAGTAVFPTPPPPGVPDPTAWQPGWIHYVFAVSLLVTLIYFAGSLFTRTGATGPSEDKKKRNRIYKACAWIMGGSLGLIVVYKLADWLGVAPGWSHAIRPVWLLEWVLFTAFAFAWMLKGDAIAAQWARSAGSRALSLVTRR